MHEYEQDLDESEQDVPDTYPEFQKGLSRRYRKMSKRESLDKTMIRLAREEKRRGIVII